MALNLTIIFSLTPLAACSTRPSTIEGVVVENKTHRPIIDAYVVFKWTHEKFSIFESKGEVCEHISIALTDASGHYKASGYNGNIDFQYWYVYKPGYHQSMDIADGYTNQVAMIGLKRIPNDTEAREQELFALLNIRCGVTDAPGDPALLPIYDAMYNEATSLPNRDPKKSIAYGICEDRGLWKYGSIEWLKMESKGYICR